MKVSLEQRLDTLFLSKWSRLTTEELSFRCMKTVFAPHFLTKNSQDTEVIYMLKMIYKVQNDE